MAIEIINVGSAPNDGTGDPLRTAYIKCNNNFGELYSRAQVDPPASLVGSVGDEAGMYAYNSSYFYYCFANYDGSSVIWAQISQSGGNVTASQIQDGTTSVGIQSPGGPVLVNVGNISNVAVFTSSTSDFSNATVSGTFSVTGNSAMGHVLPDSNNNYDLGSPSLQWRSLYAAGNVNGSNLNVTGNIVDTGALTVVTGSSGNISLAPNGTTVVVATTTGANVTGNLDVTGNVSVNNLLSDSEIISTGNITTTGYFIGTVIGNITGNFVVPGGDTQILYNGSGNAVASPNLTFVNSNLLTVTGNIATGNLSANAAISATGNITGGNIQATSGITAANGTFSGNVTTGNISGTTVSGTVSTAAQPNITSLGTLGSLAVTGNITSGNVSGTRGAFTDIAGTLETAAQTNITSVGTLSSLAVTGNITSGNISGTTGTFTNVAGTLSTAAQTNITSLGTLGSLSVTGNITSGNVSGTTGTFTNVAGTLSTAAQTNITSLGTLNLLSVTGNVAAGNVIANSDVSTSSITKTGVSGVGNIGSSSSLFNTVFATASAALYADLAESYQGDAAYPPGTVIKFGGEFEVTAADLDNDPAVAGVVSTKPAYHMNSGLTGPNVAVIALAGRVPCRVQGPVRKGQMLVSTADGRARAETAPQMGAVIGKALENFDGDLGTIEIVVGRV